MEFNCYFVTTNVIYRFFEISLFTWLWHLCLTNSCISQRKVLYMCISENIEIEIKYNPSNTIKAFAIFLLLYHFLYYNDSINLYNALAHVIFSFHIFTLTYIWLASNIMFHYKRKTLDKKYFFQREDLYFEFF